MKTLFGVLAALCYLAGIGGCVAASNSIQQIYYGIVLVIGTLFLLGAALLESLQEIRNRLPPKPARPGAPY